jgi:excisionase family DNA binding protein
MLGKLEEQPEWMDLKATQRYSCVSERTLRDWIRDPLNPLPAVQVAGGKILIKRSHFDRWLESHPFQSINSIDIHGVTDEIINQFRKAA